MAKHVRSVDAGWYLSVQFNVQFSKEYVLRQSELSTPIASGIDWAPHCFGVQVGKEPVKTPSLSQS